MSEQYRRLARLVARNYGLDPDLFERLVEAESGAQQYRQDGSVVVSTAGARGLAQLMPDTARGLGVDPDDPVQNLDGGARFLKAMLDRYGGREDLALAAYNAGPGAVDRYGGVPPYEETQTYIRKVLPGGPKVLAKPVEQTGGDQMDYPGRLPSASEGGPFFSRLDEDERRRNDEAIKTLEDQQAGLRSQLRTAEQRVEELRKRAAETETDDPTLPTPRARQAAGELRGAESNLGRLQTQFEQNARAIANLSKDAPPARQTGPTTTVKPADLKPDTPTAPRTQTIGRRVYRQNGDGTLTLIQEFPQDPPQAPYRSPEQVRMEQIKLQQAERDLLPAQTAALQNHFSLLKQLREMIQKGEIEPETATRYVDLAQKNYEAAIRGTTIAAEQEADREENRARRSLGANLVNQRLSSGSSLASALTSSAFGSDIMMPAGKTTMGYSPSLLALEMTKALGGGPEVSDLARTMLTAGEEDWL